MVYAYDIMKGKITVDNTCNSYLSIESLLINLNEIFNEL